MKQALAVLLFVILTVAVQGLDFQDERSRQPRYKKKPGPPPGGQKQPVKPPLNRDGLVAPLTRMNIPGQSVPYFVMELRVGNPPVAVNFTVDTMGRQTALPWQLCSNASEKKSTFTTGNDDWKKAPLSPGKPEPGKPSPSKPWLPAPPTTPSKPPPPPPTSSTNSGATSIVPCSHPVCRGPSFTCDKTRQRCMAYDRYSGKPIDLVLGQLAMKSVSPSGNVVSGDRTIAGLVMGCSAPSAVPYISTSMASLSPEATSLVSQLAAAANMPRRFAYCLGKPRGAFFLGGADYVFRQQSVKPKMQYLPMVTPPTMWQHGMGYRLALRGIAVGYEPDVKPLPIDPELFDNGVVIGTKLRYMTLVDPAYQVVRSHFMEVAASAAANASITPVASPFPELNLCYRIPVRAAVTRAPKVQFLFENATLTIQPRNYIVRWRRTEVVCLGIVGAGPLGRMSVIGTLQQEETLVEYDLEKRVVGVSEQLIAAGTSCRNFESLSPAPSPGASVASEDEDGVLDDEREEDGDLGIAPALSF